MDTKLVYIDKIKNISSLKSAYIQIKPWFQLFLKNEIFFLTEREPEINGILVIFLILKGVFAKNERGYRLNAIKKRF